jgi:hypothetical protein
VNSPELSPELEYTSGYGAGVSIDLACRYLDATTNPDWLPLPPRPELAEAIHHNLELRREDITEVIGAAAPLASQVRSLYLAEGLWGLEQVCRRLGTSIDSAEPEWLVEAVFSPAYKPLRGLLALSLLAVEVDVTVVQAESVQDFQNLVIRDRAGTVTWWGKDNEVPDTIPGTSTRLDGCIAIGHPPTLVWLVSDSVGYKALASAPK